MKKTFQTITCGFSMLFLLLYGEKASAQSAPTSTVQLAWNPSSSASPTNVLTYNVYYGTNSIATAPYTFTNNVGTNLSITISNLTRGSTWYFNATAQSANGLTSAYAGEVSFASQLIPAQPAQFKITVISP